MRSSFGASSEPARLATDASAEWHATQFDLAKRRSPARWIAETVTAATGAGATGVSEPFSQAIKKKADRSVIRPVRMNEVYGVSLKSS